MNRRPLIVAIKRHALHDGPGIRSVVFFKGCRLRCTFCQNPEAQDTGPEIAFSAKECIECGVCREVCPHGAVDFKLPGRIDRSRCDACGRCAAACPGKGLRLIGEYHPVEELFEILLRDYGFYHHSGGGVTLSGGECALFPDYLEKLLKALKAAGIHILVETSGDFEYRVFRQKILPYVDVIYYDLKIFDPTIHRRITGRSNRRILDNFRLLQKESNGKVHPRIPVIPGITDHVENLSSLVDFLTETRAEKVTLLPYNPAGLDMSLCLGKAAAPLPKRFMRPGEEKGVQEIVGKIIAKIHERHSVLRRQKRCTD